MIFKVATVLAVCMLLSACGKDEQPAPAPTSQDEALRRFVPKEAKHIETFEEFQARQKAESGKK